ncbi:ribonuclease T [Novosphingobium bradum]|uniref:Ribonuclease T n=1 Tax=Novosphingobium bradum TaxID=1737444 RepID=A0ABV7IQK2_9SPHN
MRALAAGLLALLPAPALAQAYQCSLPQRLAPLRPVVPDGPTRRAPITGYTLAVSWSPEFCRRDRDPASIQCSGRNGRFGFVLHGLWPEGAGGPVPQWCALTPRPAPETVRQGLCATPVPWLIEHEWAKHGSCMAQSPEAYWGIARHLWARFRWPDADRLSLRPGLTVGALREAVALANPGLPREAIGVVTSESGWLRELRICHNRQYRPEACRRSAFGPADGAGLKIWRGI